MSKKSKQVSVFVTPREYEKIKRKAREAGRSISNYGRLKILSKKK